ncbi:MAG: hypothetical protein CMP38_01530 [Rickettsiales bacterium]|nr:hypothetical protein [Rickettsiales bacterium]|tara:strand:- start:2895 stop:3137 length:243 start_codon:yes stop_codon:yes gene_type:complete
MISKILIFLTLIAILNFLMYLSITFNENISYLILNILIFLNLVIINSLKKLENKNYSQPKKEVSADDHPIIKAARERLNK